MGDNEENVEDMDLLTKKKLSGTNKKRLRGMPNPVKFSWIFKGEIRGEGTMRQGPVRFFRKSG